MSFLGKGRKEDLRILAFELDLVVPENVKVIDLKEIITKCDNYDEELVKNMLNNIIEDRLKTEKEAEKEKAQAEEQARIENERIYELEKLKLQLETQKLSQSNSANENLEQPKLEINRIIPKFNPKEDEIGLYLIVFERQLKFMNLPERTWIPYLIGSLPADVAQLIAREDEKDVQDYQKVKEMLLKRYRVTTDKFRQLFSQHRKSPDTTWRDFYFELTSYFEGWTKELKVTNFDQLKSLIIADQMKKKTPSEIKDHFFDSWAEMNNPLELAEKLDTYENLRFGLKKNIGETRKKTYSKEEYRRSVPEKKYGPVESTQEIAQSGFSKTGIFRNPRVDGRPAVKCFGCGTLGFIKSKCPICTKIKREETIVNCMNLLSIDTPECPSSLIILRIWGEKIAVCADTGASHSIAGEKLYHFLRERGTTFKDKKIVLSLADGKRQSMVVLTTIINLNVEGKIVPTELLVLPEAKGNKTLLGMDFLHEAGIVLNIQSGT